MENHTDIPILRTQKSKKLPMNHELLTPPKCQERWSW